MRKLRLFADINKYRSQLNNLLLMKTKLVLLLIILSVSNVWGQTFETFEKINPSPNLYGICGYHTLELSDGNIVFIQSLYPNESGNYGGDYALEFVKLTPSAEQIDSLFYEFKYSDSYDFINNFLIKNPYEENSYIYTYYSFGDTCYYNAIFFDNDLDVKDELRVPFYAENFNVYHHSYYDVENNVFIVSWKNGNKRMFAKSDIYGKILKTASIDNDSFKVPSEFPFFVFNKDPLQYGFCSSDYPNHTRYFSIMDEDLNLLNQFTLSKDGVYKISPDFYDNVKRTEDGNFLFVGEFYHPSDLQDHFLQLCEFDKDFNIVDRCKFKYVNNSYLYKNNKDLVLCNDGSIYCIWYEEDDNYDYDLSLHVSRIDKDFNLQWERCCKKELYIIGGAYGAVALEKGGLVLVRDISDDGDYSPDNTSVFIFQHDGTSTLDNYADFRPYSFYPNPAEDQINIRFSPDVSCERVEIYGMDGKLYHQQNFNLNTVNISNLTNGIYMMKVTLDNGNTYTEKVVVR